MLTFSPLSKILVFLAILASVFTWGFLKGANGVRDEWDAERAAQKLAVIIKEKEAVVATLKTVTVYVEKEKEAEKDDQAILDEILDTLPETVPSAYAPQSFVGLWNAANSGVPVSDPAGNPDERADGVGWKEVAAQHADESAYCRSLERQMTGLQGWVRDMQTVYSKK